MWNCVHYLGIPNYFWGRGPSLAKFKIKLWVFHKQGQLVKCTYCLNPRCAKTLDLTLEILVYLGASNISSCGTRPSSFLSKADFLTKILQGDSQLLSPLKTHFSLE